ncbi:Y-family DNA polymerase [Vagococcus vulneris]|uniref:Excinuclease ABC subunit A n=1 Tax=Vagococcus vulneris TaxID=1977869 RepID=A0A429ZWK6_9ENTE|nr:Y-family DNA polymerase [Vagococcus vulneris]RST98149.1 excinuclease ABC subunit A [Vagococcus vulneris]
MEQYFDYNLEPIHETLCVDMKSFYASIECVARGLNPLKALLVVMSHPESGGGLALAASPMAKKELGITNITRRYEIPEDPRLLIVPPRMNMYIKTNIKINNIFRRYVADEDILIYSIDESFIRVTASKKLFGMSAYEFACQFHKDIFKETGLYCTIGIGDNMLLSKLALDNEAKCTPEKIASWHYQNVPEKVWKITPMTDFWGINKRTEKRLNRMGIATIKELAAYDFFRMKESLGVIGQQLIAHAWGIDRTDISDTYTPRSKSIGNSQVLLKDYTKRAEIRIIIREMAEQVATRLRKQGMKTACVHLTIGYSKNESEKGFSRQMTIPATNQSRQLADYCLILFKRYDAGYAIRNISISFSKLENGTLLQLNLFESPNESISNQELDNTIDVIRQRYGFQSIVRASSYLEGATAIKRSTLIGGHAGGMDGL